jgi:hypothetical protein
LQLTLVHGKLGPWAYRSIGSMDAVGAMQPRHNRSNKLDTESVGLRCAGGASNSGGAVLRSFFDDKQLAALTSQIDIAKPPGLGYYPLPKAGERFPVNDPGLQPRLTPRPDSDAAFLHGYDIIFDIGNVASDST